MSTRGLYGIRKNGKDKLTYNHSDSYPDWLGAEIVEFIKSHSKDELNKFFDLIKLVDEELPPKAEEITECVKKGYVDLDVSTQSVADWYCLTRNLQGNFKLYSSLIADNKTIYMIDSHDFINDSLFCEYAYIINLDDDTLEFYVGFQKKPDKDNRYGVRPDKQGYYPCKMIKAYPLEEIGTMATIDITREMEESAEEVYG